MTHFMNENGNQLYWSEQKIVPKKEIGKQVAKKEGDENDFFISTAAR